MYMCVARRGSWLSCSLPAFPAMALVLCSSAACPSIACMTLMMLPPFSRKTRDFSIPTHRPFLRKAPGAVFRLLTSFSCELHVLPVVLTSRQPTPPHVTAHTSPFGGGGGGFGSPVLCLPRVFAAACGQ